MDLATTIDKLKGVGPTVVTRLNKLGIHTVEDLIHHYPFRYEDFSKITKIAQAETGEQVTIRGQVWSIQNTYTRFRKILTKAILNDGSSSIELVWFNQSWLTKNIKVGDKLQISGKVEKTKFKTTMVSPVWEKIISDDLSEANNSLNTGRLVPVYPETAGLSSKWFRAKLDLLLPHFLPAIVDSLPEEIIDGMISLTQALEYIHFPKSWQQVALAKNRLAFDELFSIQLFTQKTRSDWQILNMAKAWQIDASKVASFMHHLPFTLTQGQQKVVAEIIQDLQQDVAMNRLLQGEVGSGKTVVSAIIIYLCYLNGFKALLMAPTEILAQQHFRSLAQFLEPLGLKVSLYTGSTKFTKTTSEIPDLIVGTHALLSEKLVKKNIGLVVVDEQQRFGVEQRGYLRIKGDSNFTPHFLTMTATPIPRTIALTLYGDLDISTIGELPPGRQIVKTFVVPSYKRQDAYKFMQQKVEKGDQIYIVTPLIEESETLATAKAAKIEFARLQKYVFPGLRLGLLHGRLRSAEKEAVLTKFREHQLDILVSTSVVEVGVDIPNATIMVIEGAERFGLAQLHQLRGRVGRSLKESFCLLFAGAEDDLTISRLKNMEKIHDGLELSEVDMRIRGSGQVFGTAQSGRWNLKIARLTDLELIEKAKKAAAQILKASPNLDKYPLLAAKLPSLSGNIMPD